ncbi:MAG: helix-turn-helix domain-containing protein [Daejeonella sp.]
MTNEIEVTLLTKKEVAMMFKVTERTVDTLRETKQLPSYKIGGSIRFKKEDVANMIEQAKN